jgi:hypothetical protein
VELTAVVVHEHDEAAGDRVPAPEGLEDLVNRGLGVERARERLANLQQRGQAFVLVRRAVRRGAAGRKLGRHASIGSVTTKMSRCRKGAGQF